jgi:subtilisin-like proprotein convertase family protein
VFCGPAEQERLAERHATVQRYPGFTVLEVEEGDVAAISSRFPVEDISSQYELTIDGEAIDTALPRCDASGKEVAHPAYESVKRMPKGRHHYLVQFRGPVTEAWLTQVTTAGGELRTPYAGFVYVVRADEKARAAIAALPCVRWVGHLRHDLRIAGALRGRVVASARRAGRLPRTRTVPDGLTVEFFDAADMNRALTEVRKLGFKVTSKDAGSAVATVRDPGGAGADRRLRDLSAVHGVWLIRPLHLKRTSNDVAAGIMGTAASLGGTGLGLTGAGETIAVADTGLDTGVAATVHRDFAGRVAAIVSYPIAPSFNSYVHNAGADDGAADLDSGHGTHVAGSVLGDGAAGAGVSGVAAPIRGLSHRARLVFQAVEQELKWKNPADLQEYGRYLLAGIPSDLKTLFADAFARGARIHSDSWGGGDPGAYDEQCEQLDEFVFGKKDFCVLVANGNDGTDADGDGRINAMSVSSPATAKNCISVGASENSRPSFNGSTYGLWWPTDYPAAPFRTDPMANDPGQVAAFSSRGPTADGRFKPDVVAPGTFILSTRSTRIAANNMAWGAFPPSRMYFHMGGTSMATPLTAGAVGLVREFLRTRKGFASPSAALLKATVIAGARRIAGGAAVLVDNDQGYGRVDLDAVLAPQAPLASRFFDERTGLRTGDVHTTKLPVASRDHALRVVLAYSDAPGPRLVNNLNLLATAPDGTRFAGNVAPGSPLTADTRNNVEAIVVPNPAPGEWTVQVVASNVPQGPQDFALVAIGHFGDPQPAAGGVEASAAPNLAIPDNAPAGVSSTIRVDRDGTVESARVTVAIAHTFVGDLRVSLTAPDQQRIVLHERTGGSAHDLRRSYDAATTPDLSRLRAVAARGDWVLTVVDLATVDVGRLESWKLSLTLAESDPYRAASQPGLQIPDATPAGITDTVRIPGTGLVREVRVTVDITHTFIGDLRISLRSPSGRTAVLHDRTGGDADNILRTYDAAAAPSLAGFAGETAAGTWTLAVSDHAGRDVGKLNRWELRITPQP